MDFVVDTDVVSMLGKIGRITLLKRFFLHSKVYITSETIRELERARELGFDYLGGIFSVIEVIELDEETLEKSKEIAKNNRKLHITEIYSILLCRKKRMAMITNDKAAKKFCEENGIIWMDIAELLRFGFLKGKITEGEGWKIIREIEEKDKTRIKNAEKIFERKITGK
jgi:predicted nucleic acid-binding protein